MQVVYYIWRRRSFFLKFVGKKELLGKAYAKFSELC